MSTDKRPSRFTFTHPDIQDDRERLGDAEKAFNAGVNPSQGQDNEPEQERPQQGFTAQGVPEPTPTGTRVMRRFRFFDDERKQEHEVDQTPEQTEEIDLNSGEWVIEFEPEKNTTIER